ncbi:MAG: glucose-1-phosphate adenylyltransferase subunit GlgD [Eubacteriales bacterium]|nr:glucose-1-phosphate adenylyltransferase subunit GlgD [Eubacteriales bacterium]
MYRAFGIVTSSPRDVWVEGMQKHRPIGAFSFLGRYRVVDFPISNMSNSDIDRIQVYVKNKPRSLVEHVGTGRHYNINSKSGKLQILFSEPRSLNDIHNTDIAGFIENMECIDRMHHEYVVIAPNYMVYSVDFSKTINMHVESGADITLLYHSVDNAKEAFLGCNILNLNRQKGVLSIEPNHGSAKNRNIFMDTYIMKKTLFVELVKKAKSTSSAFTLSDIVNASCTDLDVRGVPHRGYFASITDFKSYYDANMDLIDIKTAPSLFDDEWPVYTRTNDSSPTHYYETAQIRDSVVSNGCSIEGTVEHSIIGRGCIIHKGAHVKNSIILADAEIGEGVYVENMVVDKRAKVLKVKKVVGDPGSPGYIDREDIV